jgi:hypothetical protein
VCKCDILSSLSSRNAFLRLTDMPDVRNAHIRQTRLPRCKCEQRRRWRCRWYPTATEAVGHIELLGTVATRAVFSSNPPKCTKLLLSISAPAFKDFRQNMMAPSVGQANVLWSEMQMALTRLTFSVSTLGSRATNLSMPIVRNRSPALQFLGPDSQLIASRS